MDDSANSSQQMETWPSTPTSVVIYGGPNCIIMPSSSIADTSVTNCSNGVINTNGIEQSNTSWNSTPMSQDKIDNLFTDVEDPLNKDNQVVSLVHESSATLIKNENSTECTFLCNHCGEKFSDLSLFAQHVCILTGDRAFSPCALPLEDPYESIQTPPVCSQTAMVPSPFVSLPTTLIAIATPSITSDMVQSIATPGNVNNSSAVSPPTLVAAPAPPAPPTLVARPRFQKIAKKPSPTAIVTITKPSTSASTSISADREKAFVCQLCGKNYSSANGLIIHERRHAGERPYPCRFCAKSFPDSSSCSRHERIHTGERPYVCEFCGRAFNDSSHLVTHRRKHTGERPYPCTQCSKAFFKSSDLKRHLRTHMAERHHPCGKCEKTFKEAAALARHERIHNGERPFTCEKCNKSFFDRSSFVRHVRIHSAERSWRCEVCDKGFFDAANLKRHARTHWAEAE